MNDQTPEFQAEVQRLQRYFIAACLSLDRIAAMQAGKDMRGFAWPQYSDVDGENIPQTHNFEIRCDPATGLLSSVRVAPLN